MNLGGWDMVSVVPMDRVNAAMAASGHTPTDFSYRERPLRIKGRFGPWRIVPGGSVQLPHVDIPIRGALLMRRAARRWSIWRGWCCGWNWSCG